MTIRKLIPCLLVATLVGGLWFGYSATAAEKSSDAAASGKLAVAKVDSRKAFTGFAKGEELQKRFTALQQEFGAARQAGDTEKAGQINKQLQQMSEEVRRLMSDALAVVAKGKKFDIVVGSHTGQDGASELETVYKATDIKVPDITDDVIVQINKLASTRPALDLPAASAPASQPTVKLNKLKLDAPKK